MVVNLISLTVDNGYEFESEDIGAAYKKIVVQEPGIKADMIVIPSGKLSCLGLISVHIEANASGLPSMTPEQTKAWLCQGLAVAFADTIKD